MRTTSTGQLPKILQRLERRRNDEEAWRQLFHSLWPKVLAVAYRILRGDHALAADAAQEVFLRLYLYADFGKFSDKPEAFPFYAERICTNVCRTYLHQVIKEPVRYESELEQRVIDVSRDTADSQSENPELAALHANQLSSFLSSLDAQDRQLVEILLEGADTAQVAERLSISYANAAVRIHRLRNRLFKLLKIHRI